jgi:hypothetical protein
MLAESALADDPALAATAEDDRVCPGCLRRLDLPPSASSRRRTDRPWWPVALTLVALCISVAFAYHAERAHQIVLRSRTQLLDLRQSGTEGAVDHKPLFREARAEALREAAAMAEGESAIALALAAVAVGGVVGGASAAVRRQVHHGDWRTGCGLCAPSRRSRISPLMARSWRRVEGHLVALSHVLLVAYGWVVVSNLLTGSALTWHLADQSAAQLLAIIGAITRFAP